MTRDRRTTVLVVVVVVLTMLPFLVVATRVLAGHRIAPDGDTALIELRTRDVFSRHPPLVGSHERFGFNMPGPLLFVALAVPYRLLGSNYGALQAGAVLVNALAAGAILLVAWRRGRAPLLAWTAAVLLVLLHGLGANGLGSPWEPYSTVLPAIALAALTWETIVGSPWAVVPAVVVASYVAQAYISFVLVAIVLGAVAVTATVARGIRTAVRPWRALAVAGASVVVLWSAPLVDALARDPGNVRRALDFLRRGSRPIGVRDGYRLVALQLGLTGSWSGSAVRRLPFQPYLDLGAAPVVPWLLVILVAAFVAAVARRRSDAATLGGVVLLIVLVLVASFSRVTAPLFPWLGDPARVVGFLGWWAAGWCAWAAWRTAPLRVQRRVRLALAGAVGVTVVAAATATTLDAARDRADPATVARAVDRLVAATAPVLRASAARTGPVLVRTEVNAPDVLGSSGTGRQALVLALERRGIATRVGAGLDEEVSFGAVRATAAGTRGDVVLTALGAAVPPGYRVGATIDPLTPEQRAVRRRFEPYRALTLEQAAKLFGSDPAYRALLRELRDVPDLPALQLLYRIAP